MKERGILMSAPMVRAILRENGPKTQTRRLVAGEALHKFKPEFVSDPENGLSPGDRLWVREAWRTQRTWDHLSPANLPIAGEMLVAQFLHYEADGKSREIHGRYRHARFMPRWASRITLDVTGIRVERLQEISVEDAKAEGLEGRSRHPRREKYGLPEWDWEPWRQSPIDAYQLLWESINGPGSWDANPWVWVVEFRRVEP